MISHRFGDIVAVSLACLLTGLIQFECIDIGRVACKKPDGLD